MGALNELRAEEVKCVGGCLKKVNIYVFGSQWRAIRFYLTYLENGCVQHKCGDTDTGGVFGGQMETVEQVC